MGLWTAALVMGLRICYKKELPPILSMTEYSRNSSCIYESGYTKISLSLFKVGLCKYSIPIDFLHAWHTIAKLMWSKLSNLSSYSIVSNLFKVFFYVGTSSFSLESSRRSNTRIFLISRYKLMALSFVGFSARMIYGFLSIQTFFSTHSAIQYCITYPALPIESAFCSLLAMWLKVSLSRPSRRV